MSLYLYDRIPDSYPMVQLDSPAMLLGETGVGKEVIADAFCKRCWKLVPLNVNYKRKWFLKIDPDPQIG
jgi:hypothetical protein